MKVYAIRLKGTNKYMPGKAPSKLSKNFSSTEPKEAGGRYGPRLFPSLQSARNSLTAWLQGEWYWHFVNDYYEEDVFMDVMKKPDRQRDKMEIVEFELNETETI